MTAAAFLRHRWFRLGISAAISLLFVLLVEHFLGWRNILAPWRGQPWHVLFLLLALAAATLLLRTWRLYDYFRSELRGRFAACAKLTILNNMYNILLPMRSGELSFPLLMQRYFAIGAQRSLPVLLWFRLLDLHTVLALGIVTVAWQFWPPPLVALAAALWLPLPALFPAANAWLQQRARASDGWRRLLLDALNHLPNSYRHLARDWLWTWLNWTIKFMVFAWVLSLFLPLSPGAALSGAIAGDLTSVLPVHGFAGTGTYEAGVVAGLALYPLSAQQALQGAINLHLFILGNTLLAALLTWPLPVAKPDAAA